jgi:CheY-like chemotaxis protein
MKVNLVGKTILIVEASLLATDNLKDALFDAGARVYSTANILNAFDLVSRTTVDGVIIDQGLHNEVFDLCEELRAQKVPHLCASTPHRLQGVDSRRREAENIVWRLCNRMQSELKSEQCVTHEAGEEYRMDSRT